MNAARTNADAEKGSMYVVSAPSGAGKTSLIKCLMAKDDHIGVSISHTTRKQRKDEVDGEHYHFIDEAEFHQMKERGDFLEWADVFGNFYGTSSEAVDRVLNSGLDLILEIDWQGAQQIRKNLAGVNTIFVLPPSYQSLLDRLIARDQDDDATVKRRMADAVEHISHFDEFDYVVINDDFERALEQMSEIVHGKGEAYSLKNQQARLEPLIEELMAGKSA